MALVARIPVRLGPRRYDVFIGRSHLGSLGSLVRRLRCGNQPVLITNPTILSGPAQAVAQALTRSDLPVRTLTVGDTERSKGMESLKRLLHQLADLDGPGRQLFLVLVGGGVVGDLGGMAAGIYRRGIPYIQVPTTLLAQVDSSIGGKTGVDLPQGKNLAGLFYQPRLVFIELDFLRSLPERQFRSGLAEVVKCSILRDPRLFSFLERTPMEEIRRREDLLGWMIARAVRVKATVVEEDEQETKGVRTILNFGHTLGHALEAATGYTRATTHGEAVALGMSAATAISQQLGRIGEREAARITELIQRLGFPVAIRGIKITSILQAMAHDKKWTLRPHCWVLPTGIGQAVVEGVPERVVRQTLARFLEG